LISLPNRIDVWDRLLCKHFDVGLSLSDLSTACKQLQLDQITGDHLQQFFKYADLDGDSFIEKDDWSYVLRQGSKFTFLEGTFFK
jgi:hypothetical protein